MIYTKEPAKTYYVYLTAYRSWESTHVNEIFTDGLTKHIQAHPEVYGTTLNECVVGSPVRDCIGDTVERTLQVHCTSWRQVLMLAELAHVRYDQESILVVNSQTHTASLVVWRTIGEYPQAHGTLDFVRLGTFTQQYTNRERYLIIDGARWEVAE